jgi:multimeric flavodoxin WrbA
LRPVPDAGRVRSIAIVSTGNDPDGQGSAEQGLLVVQHSRTGTTKQLCDAAVAAATEAVAGHLPIRVLGAFDAGPDDVLWARGLLMATPARFGYMSGALKDFFERVYHPCLERTRGLPYALVVKGDTDVDGAVASVERIATGLAWRPVLPPVTVVGDVDQEHLAAAAELGASLAAGLEAGIF